MSLVDLVAVPALVLGTLLMLLASLGVVRMPDVYTRLSATSKAAPLGTILLLGAAAMVFGTVEVGVRVVGITAFLALTSPVGAHLLARSAHRTQQPHRGQVHEG